MKIREAKFAGMFYPAGPGTLKRRIDEFISRVDITVSGDIIGIIVPHAGYDYSGETAAYAYKQIKGREFKNVIILAPSHRYPLNGGAVYPSGEFETPLGAVKINEELCSKIINESERIEAIEEAHIEEHSLEVQLPFLQVVLKEGWQLVPMLVGTENFALCLEIADAIVKYLDDPSLLTISSDFYHGWNYNECVILHKKANELIENFSTEKFFDYYLSHESKGVCVACGGVPITIGMLIAEKLNASEIKLLYYTNSADVIGGAKSGYVVGYSAFTILK